MSNVWVHGHSSKLEKQLRKIYIVIKSVFTEAREFQKGNQMKGQWPIFANILF